MIQGQNPTSDYGTAPYAPQNGYRSYDDERVFRDEKSWNNDRVSHERLSHAQMIVRANGGNPSVDAMTNTVGRWQSDGK